MLITTPRDYQATDIQLMHEDPARYFAYDMGCGKSLVPIAYIDKHKDDAHLMPQAGHPGLAS